MLNYNKIQSDINKGNINLTDIAKFGKLKYGSFRDRYIEERLYANEIEIIAQFFERTIDYYFDREGKQAYTEAAKTVKMDVVTEPIGLCPVCATKDKLILSYEKQISLLEFSLGKKSATSK